MHSTRKQFAILRDRPTVDFYLTRDSVCAGDDVDAPHEMVCTTHSFIDPVDLARELASPYLPSVAGYGHSWDCLINEVLIATVQHDGITAHTNEVPYQDRNRIHFRYHSAAEYRGQFPRPAFRSIY